MSTILKGMYRFGTMSLRGKSLIVSSKVAYNALKISWTAGVKTAVKTSWQTGKLAIAATKTVKFTKAFTLIGALDVALDLGVQSTLDRTWVGLIPGSGLLQFGAAILNRRFHTRFFNARYGLI